MMFNKKLFLFLLLITFSVFTEAQTVKVKKENARIKNENIIGFQVDLEGTETEVSNSFFKFLKTIGKVKQSETLTVNEPTLNGNKYTVPFYGEIKENGKTTSAWVGIIASEWPADDVEKINKELEKLVYEYGVKFYKDKIQVQIDESIRAATAVDKQKQRLVNENKSLTSKIEDNKREKIQLEKAIENNKIELETLIKKLEQNKKAQDSVANVSVQVNKVVDMHKEKQKKVN